MARDFVTGRLGLNPVPYKPPDRVSVLPPVKRDATRGFILSSRARSRRMDARSRSSSPARRRSPTARSLC
jgi:hypothetical protein